ncbi:hypothetical protein DL765_008990 [Monosporascus sp. GIB2]|nr:hypothetical protein DL765_008990 [Monosporascus sp. GIB2]
MAEALGVAASGIAIAQVTSQVGVAVVKLKKFCDEVKDVPDDIANLLQQIDCLDPALCEAENSFESTGLPAMLWNDAAAKRSTTYCRNALKALTEIVDEMAVQIKHHRRLNRKVASVKVVLRKDTLKKLEKRLENAVRMLTLAQQSYIAEVFEVTRNGVPHDLQRMFDMGLASPFDYERYKYGPEPEDWDVYWSEPTDEFAGDFWELVENPPLQVPGAWDPGFDDET